MEKTPFGENTGMFELQHFFVCKLFVRSNFQFAAILWPMKMINSNQKDSEDELGSVFDDQTMKANDKVITTIYCLIFIIGLVCNVSGLGYFNLYVPI